MKLRATGYRICVLEDSQRQVHVGSKLVIPLKFRRPPCEGWVVSVGRDAAKLHPELREGLRVVWRPYAGIGAWDYDRIEKDGRRYRLLTPDEMIGVIGQPSVDAVTAGK